MRSRLGAATVLAVLLVPQPSARAGGAGGPLRDGNWAGTMSTGATVGLESGGGVVVVTGHGTGSFALNLAGGVATGQYTLNATSDLVIQGPNLTGSADATIAFSGILDGLGGFPILALTAGHVDVSGTFTTSSGNEITVNHGQDYGPGDVLSSTLVIAASSCTLASGTWAHEFKAAAEAGGASVTNFQGSWAARFTGATPAATDAALADIVSRGEAIFSEWYATGTFDANALEEVLLAAEHFAATARVSEVCSGRSAGLWASPLAGVVQRLLTAVAASDSTTPEVLRYAVAAGLRTNVLPSADADTLEDELIVKADELLTAAIAAADKAALHEIAATANAMGWTDLAARATAALGELG